MLYPRAFRLLTLTLITGIVWAAIAGCGQSGSQKWTKQKNHRWKPMSPSFHLFETSGFRKKSPDITGISFQNRLTDKQIKQNRNLLNGSGVAAGDVNGDNLIDLYFARLNGPNKLYLNRGNWGFDDITKEAGLELENQFSTGVNFADLDGDADLDLIVTALGSTNKVFMNDGGGHFTKKKKALGGGVYGSMSSALGDIDQDGDLDLYITNYKERSAKDIYPRQRKFNDIIKQTEEGAYYIPDHLKPHYKYEMRGDMMLWFEKGENDLLFRNDGSGNFTKVPFSSGVFKNSDGETVLNHKGWGLHARFFDINEDGYPDLYVCNDFETPDRVWINEGDGTFTKMKPSALRHLSLSSMSVDMADINRDSEYDIFVAEMLSRDYSQRSKQLSTMIPLPDTTGTIFNQPLYMGNALYLNRGDNTYAEIADYSGVRASEWSWSSSFMDVDLDGYEDLIVATGNYFDTQNLDANSKIARKEQMGAINPAEVMFEYPPRNAQNVIFRNKGNLRFEDKSTEWGFTQKDISHGLAHADLDNDGDQDLIFNRLESRAGLYENKATKPRIRIKLKGTPPNVHAIGSTITVSMGSLDQKVQVTASGSYLSGSSSDYTFAASNDSSMTIRVRWADQSVTTIRNVKANRYYEIFKNKKKTQAKSVGKTAPPDSVLFQDVSGKLNHRHTDRFYKDFEKQPLLPYKLSQPGPGVSFFDANNDGADDLFIGSGKGGQLAYFQNDGRGNFHRKSASPLSGEASSDQAAIVGWHGGNGSQLLIGNYYYEEDSARAIPYSRFTKKGSGPFRRENAPGNALPGTATGPLALADIDSDHDLDLFVGKRFAPARYPVPVSSYLFENKDGKFVLNTEESSQFKNTGPVSSAVFSDFDLDGDPDLLLATEWGPIRVYTNKKGRFTETTGSTLFKNLKGNWNGITTGDFNNDGRPDIIATNQGLNNFHHSKPGDSRYLYYGNLNPKDRDIEIIEAHDEKLQGSEAIVPSRKLTLLGSEIPLIGKQFWSFEQFSKSSVEGMLGNYASRVDTLKATHSRSMLFLNHASGFEANPLPPEAQFAPAYAAVVSDYNGDGNEDLFLSQNFFATRTGDKRKDAGRGLLLQGDGTGNLEAVPASRSGLMIYGQQRAAAASDIDHDHRIDLVVSQNGGTTKLYKNRGARKGITITLKGAPGNPDAVGASVRLLYRDQAGPRRTIKAGSGYWSQNTKDILLGYKRYPKGIQVKWPDGKTERFDISQQARHVIIHHDGTIQFP